MSQSDGPNTPAAAASDAELLDLLASELNAPETDDSANSARIAELERRLAERNQLVEILTEKLEQAADQIDRLQRTGGALKTDAPAGLPPEFLNEHRDLAQRVEAFHTAWEERYEGPSLRRIEASLSDLMERFDELRSLAPPSGASRAPQPAQTSSVTSFLDQYNQTNGRNSGDTEAYADDGEDSPEPTQHADATPAASGSAPSRMQSALPRRIEIVLLSADEDDLPADVPLPGAIDVHEATHGDLQDAVLQRDRFIDWLCKKVRELAAGVEQWLRHYENEQSGTPSGEQFQELRQHIRSHIQVLEIELSIERAKLFREQSRLEQEQERLKRDRDLFEKQRGAATGGENETALMKRWKRFIQPE